MEINSKVCSLELSQALDKAGVKAPSERVWFKLNTRHSQEWIIDTCGYDDAFRQEKRLYNAYDVSELLSILPETINAPFTGKYKVRHFLGLNRIHDLYVCSYDDVSDTLKHSELSEIAPSSKSLSDCLAKLLLKLIGEKLVEV